MGVWKLLSKIVGADNVDRKAERRIKKSNELYHKGGKINRLRANRLFNRNLRDFSCYISPRATIGRNLYIAHPIGIVIGKTAIIGDNCRIYPYAFIAAKIVGDKELRASGETRWHAKIGNNCMLGAGCMIIGRIEIGDNVTIAARAMVTKDVPPNSVVTDVNKIRPKTEEELKFAESFGGDDE